MSNILSIAKQKLVEIANIIREKLGTTQEYSLEEIITTLNNKYILDKTIDVTITNAGTTSVELFYCVGRRPCPDDFETLPGHNICTITFDALNATFYVQNSSSI